MENSYFTICSLFYSALLLFVYFSKKRKNNLVLRDSQIEILKKYNIDYEKHTNLNSLIFEIEEILNYETDLEDLENLSEELQEMNYYNYTNK